MNTTVPASSSLNAARRAADLVHLESDPGIDVLVVGGGVTGAGVALDAAARGLTTVLVERDDLAFGTSRWSSKLVHGGLRYLAKGQIGIAYESARERDVLMRVTAPHLVRPLPMVMPVHRHTGLGRALLSRGGMGLGDLLRRAAGTPGDVLPRPRTLDARQTLRLLPTVDPRGLVGGVLSFDGQLVDDARLVVALARTAAREGARVITRCSAENVTRDGVTLRDGVTGRLIPVRPRAVVNATGVHADALDPGVRLSPSRGTHLVLDGASLGRPRAALTAPVPGSLSRFVFALPQPDGRVLAGLTDEPVEGPVPRVPYAPEEDVDTLLSQFNRVLSTHLTRDDVLGTFAGLRPLLHGEGESSDLSREHSVAVGPNGAVTVVGGKLTTYRAMAEEAVDAAVAAHRLPAGPCRTRELPLVGAAPAEELAALAAGEGTAGTGAAAGVLAGASAGARGGVRAVRETHGVLAGRGGLGGAAGVDGAVVPDGTDRTAGSTGSTGSGAPATPAVAAEHVLPDGPAADGGFADPGVPPVPGVPAAFVARYGAEAPAVAAEAAGDPALLEPVVRGVTGAELRFGVRHEGAMDVGDLLDRRCRVGWIPTERAEAEAAAAAALDAYR